MSTNLNYQSALFALEMLEERQKAEIEALKSQWNETKFALNLGNLVQRAISHFDNPATKNSGFVNRALGVSTGILIDKIYPKKPEGLIAKISKLSFEIIAGNLVANNSNKIISLGLKLLKKMTSKNESTI